MSFRRAGEDELKRLKKQKPREMKILAVPSGDQDDDAPKLYRAADPYLPELDGEVVVAVCTKKNVSQNKRMGPNASRTLFLTFKLIEEPYLSDKVSLWLPFALSKDPRGMSEHSKYPRAWAVANGAKAGRNERRLSPKVFLGSVFEVRCKTVKRGGIPKREMPEVNWYTKVDQIERLVQRNFKDKIP